MAEGHHQDHPLPPMSHSVSQSPAPHGLFSSFLAYYAFIQYLGGAYVPPHVAGAEPSKPHGGAHGEHGHEASVEGILTVVLGLKIVLK